MKSEVTGCAISVICMQIRRETRSISHIPSVPLFRTRTSFYMHSNPSVHMSARLFWADQCQLQVYENSMLLLREAHHSHAEAMQVDEQIVRYRE